MTLGPAEIAAMITLGSTAGSMLFWGTLLLGRLLTRMERVESKTDDLDKRMDRAGEKMSDLADAVQTMPDRVRRELLVRGGNP